MKSKKTKINLSGIVLFLLVSGAGTFFQCTNTEQKDNVEAIQTDNAHEEEHGEEIVQLSQEEMEEFGIETAKAGPGKLVQHVNLTGEIVIDPDRLAHIFPRFPGIVKEVRKKIGDSVKTGEVLAVIESNESLTAYEVKSLIDGKVIDMHLTMGEVIANGGHSFTIADLSKVWVNLNVYQKNLPDIRLRQNVVINARPDTISIVGRISYFSPTVNEETRTATARVVLDNRYGHWRPGLFVNGKVIIREEAVKILVPKNAVTVFENRNVVFVKHEEGFVPQPVTIGRSSIEKVEIVAGLEPGQVYVAKGSFTLKAELQKKSFGGHQH